MLQRMLFALCVFALAGCAPTPAADVVFSGNATYLERIATPPDAELIVELRDQTRPNPAGQVVTAQTFAIASGPPYAFSLSAPADEIGADASLIVVARLRDSQRLLFAAEGVAVPREGATGLEIRMAMVASDPPELTTYRCGEETFRISFLNSEAHVYLPDGSGITLRRLNMDADPEEPRRFSDGRLTFVQEIEGDGRVLFARGRMAPAPCERGEIGQ